MRSYMAGPATISYPGGTDVNRCLPAHEADDPQQPRDREPFCLDGGRCTTQFMRDSLGLKHWSCGLGSRLAFTQL